MTETTLTSKGYEVRRGFDFKQEAKDYAKQLRSEGMMACVKSQVSGRHIRHWVWAKQGAK